MIQVKVAKGQHVEGAQQKAKDRTWEYIPFQRLGSVCYGACKGRPRSEKGKQGWAFPQKTVQEEGAQHLGGRDMPSCLATESCFIWQLGSQH